MTEPKLKITQAGVVVAGVDIVIDELNLKVWHVDLPTKGAKVLGFTHQMVVLQDAYGVAVSIPLGLDDSWQVIAECARYTCRIVAYRETPYVTPGPCTCGRENVDAPWDHPTSCPFWVEWYTEAYREPV